MSRLGLRRRTSAALGVMAAVGAVTLGVAPLPLLTGGAAAAPTVATVDLTCNLPAFNRDFDWSAEITATGVTDLTDTALTVAMSDMPGVSPVPVEDSMSATVVVDAGGSAVTLTGSERVTAAANAPVPVPDVTGIFASSAATVDLTLTSAAFVVSGIEINCVPVDDGTIGTVEVEEGTLPTPTPTPSPSPTTSPTPTPKPSESPKNTKGVPATGTARFSCTLEELGSPFDYNPKVTVAGARAAEGDSKVTLRATFSDIPGLAPVPINGDMKVTASVKVGDQLVDFADTSRVNVAAKAEVPVPTLTATMTTDEVTVPVEVTAFKFDFGEMSGMSFYSDCDGGGKLSDMTIGVGDDGGTDPGDDNGDDGDPGDDGTTTPSSLPKTGSGAPLTVLALWSSALMLVSVALFLLLPRSRRAPRG